MSTVYELWARRIGEREFKLAGTYETYEAAWDAGKPAVGRPVQQIEVREAYMPGHFRSFEFSPDRPAITRERGKA